MGVTYIRNFIKHTNNKSKIDSIQSIFIAPAILIDAIGYTARTGYIGPGQTGLYEYLDLDESNSPVILSLNFNVVHSFSDFTPKNR